MDTGIEPNEIGRVPAPAKLLELRETLRGIAKKNDDRFSLLIEIVIMPDQTLSFQLEARETAEGHSFAAGAGPTLESAVDKLLGYLPSACDSWGYEMP